MKGMYPHAIQSHVAFLEVYTKLPQAVHQQARKAYQL